MLEADGLVKNDEPYYQDQENFLDIKLESDFENGLLIQEDPDLTDQQRARTAAVNANLMEPLVNNDKAAFQSPEIDIDLDQQSAGVLREDLTNDTMASKIEASKELSSAEDQVKITPPSAYISERINIIYEDCTNGDDLLISLIRQRWARNRQARIIDSLDIGWAYNHVGYSNVLTGSRSTLSDNEIYEHLIGVIMAQ